MSRRAQYCQDGKILPKLIYRVNRIPTKMPAGFFFVEIDNQILKFHMEVQRPYNSQNFEKNEVENIHYLTSRLTMFQ